MSDPREAERQLEEILAEHRDENESGSDDPGTPDPATAPDPFDPFAMPTPDPVGVDEDAAVPDPDDDARPDDLPDAPLFALLRTVEQEIGVPDIDRLWVFPPRRLQVGETAVVVVASFPPDDEDRRRVHAAHYAALDDVDEPRLVLREFGTAPTDRVGRLVEEVVERLHEDPAGAPRSHRIDGDPDRWHRALHELAEAWLEEAGRNPRLRR